MGANEYWVYFDYNKVSDNDCVLAAIVMEGKNTYTPKFKKVIDASISGDDNQFTLTILALNNAINLVQEAGLTGKLNLQHQNKVVIDWLSRGYSNFTYDSIFGTMYENFKKIYIKCNGEVYLGHINAKQNHAKKYCKTERANKIKEQQPLHKVVIVDEELEEEPDNRKRDNKVVNLYKF